MNTVLFCVGSRANYASIRSAIKACIKHTNINTKVLVYASAASGEFGQLTKVMSDDSVEVSSIINTLVLGDSPQQMAESTGLALVKLPQAISDLAPQVVVTVGDRYETLAVAIAASYMNVVLAHTMGGEITGSIDESIRHAITKLAHLHFPATELAAKNIKNLGEEKESIHMVGCPRLDLVSELAGLGIQQLEGILEQFGWGDFVDVSKPFLLVSQHPVTTEFYSADEQIKSTLDALDTLNYPTILLWPNSDAGHEHFNKVIRGWLGKRVDYPRRLFRNLPPLTYLKLMSLTSCLVGNSSSGIREGSLIGTPVVNIGSRQLGRESSENVLHADASVEKIVSAINRQISHGTFLPSRLYGDGNAGERIAEILGSQISVPIQKRLRF
jgi:UDP-hydrolysing UDP-N-acetyl-D-glucosamine 2-epimerase